jgi:hypothetical protein
MAQITLSRPDYGLTFQVQVFTTFFFLFSLGRGRQIEGVLLEGDFRVEL